MEIEDDWTEELVSVGPPEFRWLTPYEKAALENRPMNFLNISPEPRRDWSGFDCPDDEL